MTRIECPSEAWDRHVTQNEEGCEVCHEHIDNCDCPECLRCGSVGDPACYEQHGLELAHDSIDSYCDWVGITPIRSCLRATDKYCDDGLVFVMRDGRRFHSASNKDRLAAEELKPWERISKVIVVGIAWDDSDWVHEEAVVAGNGWSALSQARDNFVDALEEHRALMAVELPCYRERDGGPGDKSWGCMNDHTGCMWNDGHNTCGHPGESSGPLEEEANNA